MKVKLCLWGGGVTECDDSLRKKSNSKKRFYFFYPFSRPNFCEGLFFSLNYFHNFEVLDSKLRNLETLKEAKRKKIFLGIGPNYYNTWDSEKKGKKIRRIFFQNFRKFFF